MSLALYLCTIISIDTENFEYHPMELAAAICHVVAKKYGLIYNQSIRYWSSYGIEDLTNATKYVEKVWRNNFETANRGRANYIQRKYNTAQRHFAAAVEPIM